MTPCRSGSSRLQTATPSSRWSTQSRDLHRPWAYPPERADQFDELLSRCARDDFACFVVIDDDTGDIAGVFNISQIVRGSFQSAFLGYYGSARYAGKGLMRARRSGRSSTTRSARSRCTASRPTSSPATPPRSRSRAAPASASRATRRATC